MTLREFFKPIYIGLITALFFIGAGFACHIAVNAFKLGWGLVP